MHIAINGHLISFDRSFRQAGVSNHILWMLRELAHVDEHNRYTVFVGPGISRDQLGLPERFAVVQSRLPTILPKYRIPWEQCIAPLLLAHGRYTLFHGTLNIAPLLSPVPTVITIHDLAFLDVTGSHRKINRLYLNWSTRLGARRAAHILTVSEYSKQAIIKRLGVPAERISVGYNAPAAHFRPRPAEEIEAFRRAKGLPERYLFYLGTLEPRKNIPMLLRAYARVRDELGVPLLIGGGKGWNYDEIFATYEQLGLQDDITFLGYVPAEEQPLWYAAALAFVFPARYEGFGMPPLEAMASGTPVITTTATSLPEVVGDAALLVDPNDIDGMAAALRHIVRDEELRAELRERGLRRASQFHWRDLALRALEVYRSVAGLPAQGALTPSGREV